MAQLKEQSRKDFTPPLYGGFFMVNNTFTSESVCAGHPDKICDAISDAIVDAALSQDPKSRVAVETLVTTNKVILAGEVTSKAKLDYKKTAREQIKRLGYTKENLRFTYNSPITVAIHEQSNEIAKGVDDQGAGDQGMMFGFACDETKELMPLPITLAHELAEKIDEARNSKIIPYLRPDGKTQVTISYDDEKPVKIEEVVLAAPHSEKIKLSQLIDDLYKSVVKPTLLSFGFSFPKKRLVVNGTGVWHLGGPASDTGVTGRKIVVDTYGGYARVGGGAFSGKDPTKVDRSGAYAARFLAKNIVAAGLAKKAEVRLAYFIGAKKPLMQEIETFGTGKKSSKIIADFAKDLLDTSVAGILKGLNLQRPIYLPTSAYGHFGRDIFPWEKVV